MTISLQLSPRIDLDMNCYDIITSTVPTLRYAAWSQRTHAGTRANESWNLIEGTSALDGAEVFTAWFPDERALLRRPQISTGFQHSLDHHPVAWDEADTMLAFMHYIHGGPFLKDKGAGTGGQHEEGLRNGVSGHGRARRIGNELKTDIF